MTILQLITHPLSLWLIAVSGMLAHYLKVRINGETLNDIWNYLFKDHVKQTIISFIAVNISYVIYIVELQSVAGQLADCLTVFLLGYFCDNAFNKFTVETKEDKPR